jgi:hypothetical protein
MDFHRERALFIGPEKDKKRHGCFLPADSAILSESAAKVRQEGTMSNTATKLRSAEKFAFTREDTAILKGLAILMMLFHHLFTYDYRLAEGVGYISLGSYYGSKYETILGAFCQLCVAMFLLLGGYGTWLSYEHAQNRREKWLHKIGTLYLGFWKVFIIFIPIAILLNDPAVVPVQPLAMLENLLALRLTYNEEWWFLTPYLLLSLAFPLIYRWLGRKHAMPWLDAALIVALQVPIQKLLPQAMAEIPFGPQVAGTLLWQQFYAALYWAGPFLLGCLAAKENWLARAWEKLGCTWARYLFSAAILLVVLYTRMFGGRTFDCVFSLLFILAAGAILRDIPGLRRFLAAFGQRSMTMWLVHSFYCYHFCQAFVYSPRWPLLIFALLAAMSYGTAWVLETGYTALEKACGRLTQH